MSFSVVESDVADDELFFCVHFPTFYKDAVVQSHLRTVLREERLLASRLRARLGHKRLVGMAFYPWHDQTTLWWFEQGLLNLLAMCGWEVDWYTDAKYHFDDILLSRLPGTIRLHRVQRSQFEAAAVSVDGVISLFPDDLASSVSREHGVPLTCFAIKNVDERLPPFQQPLPSSARLWHAFAGSENFFNALRALDFRAEPEQLQGAPFPVNRYYLPVRDRVPDFDVMLFGSNHRELDTLVRALRPAGVNRFLALVEPKHQQMLRALCDRHAVSCTIAEPCSHERLTELVLRSRVIANPIVPPAESHYSISFPLALGRAVVASDIPQMKPYVGAAFSVARLGDPDDWAAKLRTQLQVNQFPNPVALKQAHQRHDAARFFASALMQTL